MLQQGIDGVTVMQAKQMTHIDVLDKTSKLSDQIKQICKDLGEVTNQHEKRQQHLKGTLKSTVFQMATLIFSAIEHKVIAADSTGIITGKSIYPNPLVDEYAELWRAKQDQAKLADICQLNILSGQAGGSFTKATAIGADGTVTIFDRIKGTMTVIWNGISHAFSWCVKQAIALKDWLVMKAKEVWRWFASFFKGKGNNVVSLDAKRKEQEAIKDAQKISDEEILQPMPIAA